MATRLIIEGNAVYEIDEDCLERQKRKSACPMRMRGQECTGRGQAGLAQEDRKSVV